MKKIIVATAAALLAVGAQAATYKDGSYTGEGKGRESVITVQVDVKGGKIADVKVCLLYTSPSPRNGNDHRCSDRTDDSGNRQEERR